MRQMTNIMNSNDGCDAVSDLIKRQMIYTKKSRLFSIIEIT